MNNKLSALLSTAIVSGLLAAQVAKAEDASAPKSNEAVAAEKNNCKGHKGAEKNNCKAMKAEKKKGDKNSCKNGCGEAKDQKKDETKKDQ